MRKERLTGFVIHQRAYREKRAIYTLFCENVGMIDGVGAKGLLSFLPIDVFATGKTALKTFSEPTYLDKTSMLLPSGQAYYAGLYLNELLYKTLAKENPSNTLWQSYQVAIDELSKLPSSDTEKCLKLTLRRFELRLFDELGVGLDWQTDWQSDKCYQFTLDLGFVLCDCAGKQDTVLTGAELKKMAQLQKQLRFGDGADCDDYDDNALKQLGAINKARIDELLGYRPLHSRRLWQDMMTLKTKERG